MLWLQNLPIFNQILTWVFYIVIVMMQTVLRKRRWVVRRAVQNNHKTPE